MPKNSGTFKKGSIPWIKGKHHSNETRKKISDSKQNIPEKTLKRMSEAQIGKHNGEKNPMYGKTHTKESRKKISEAVKGKNTGTDHYLFGKHPSDETRKKQSAARKGKMTGESNPMFGKKGKDHPIFGLKRSKESCKKISVTRKLKIASGEIAINKKVGAENPMWKGGISFGSYCFRFNEQRKRAVRDYFNNLCICTGEPQYNKALNVHHVDHDKEQGCNGKPFNLVPMCDKHHNLEQHHREEYKAYINKTLREGFKWGIWNEEEYMEKVMY